VIEVTEPQVWVLIAVFATAIFSMIGIVSVSFTRTVISAISGLEGRIAGLEGRVDAQIQGLRDTMDARFDAMNSKFELLDRDIQALSKRVFGAE